MIEFLHKQLSELYVYRSLLGQQKQGKKINVFNKQSNLTVSHPVNNV